MYSSKSSYFWTCLSKTFSQGNTERPWSQREPWISKSRRTIWVPLVQSLSGAGTPNMTFPQGALWPLRSTSRAGPLGQLSAPFVSFAFIYSLVLVLCVETSRVSLIVLAPRGPSRIWKQVWGPLQDFFSLSWTIWVPYRTWYRNLSGRYSDVCIAFKERHSELIILFRME